MENTEKKETMEGSKCCGGFGMGSCSCGHGYGKMRLFFLVRVLITLIILIIVFWCGFRLGVLQGSFGREYSGRSMMMYGGYGNVYGGQTGGVVPYGAQRQGTSTVQ